MEHVLLRPRLARLVLACALALCLMPASAFADEPASADAVDLFAEDSRQSIEAFLASGNPVTLYDLDAYGASDGAMPFANGLFPERFDLREQGEGGVVTPVKQQNPWGTCWSFGAIAAAETSILSELGVTMADGGIDLSELHLAWFGATPLKDGGSQDGEGIHALHPEAGDSGVLDQGGYPFMATSVFSSGVGPVDEEDAPYKNKRGLTLGEPSVFYSNEGDWSVDEDKRFLQAFELEHSAVLPSSVRLNADGSYGGVDWSAVDDMKRELFDGRAVEIGFLADQSQPGEVVGGKGTYINLDTWAHHTYEVKPANHAVAIVGWDDAYPKSNFNADHQPEGDGAWIVKNSWGAKGRGFPNENEWGIDGSGYFYLSYYDRSIEFPETFDFDVDAFGRGAHYYLIDQYDYLPSKGTTAVTTPAEAAMANVFVAEEDQLVRALSCETAKPDTAVAYEVRLLGDASENPRDGELLATASAAYEHGGYHRINLEEPCLVRRGERYAVVAEQRCGDGYAVMTNRALNKVGVAWQKEIGGDEEGGFGVGVVNPGESLLLSAGRWQDWSEAVGALQARDAREAGLSRGPYDYDNFPLKAYADPADVPDEMVAVPDLAGMTEVEALAALEGKGLKGAAGEAMHSESVAAGLVAGQSPAVGTEVESGATVAYRLSLGPAPLAPPDDGSSLKPQPLAPTGDGVSGAAAAVSLCALVCALLAVRSLRLLRGSSALRSLGRQRPWGHKD